VNDPYKQAIELYDMGNLDSIFGAKMDWINQSGRTIQKGEMVMVEDVAPVKEKGCKHSYVVRSIVGANRFHCKECDKGFPSHPKSIKKPTPSDKTIGEIMQSYRDGVITFSDTIKQTQFSVEQFKNIYEKLFPPQPIYKDISTIGGNRGRALVDTEPSRTSCPLEVEKAFHDMDGKSNPAKMMERFLDITGSEYEPFGDQAVITLIFCDKSKQRIVVAL